MTSLAGRVALVTGGTGALGQAVTLRLLTEGATVGVPWVVEQEHEALRGRIKPADRDRILTARADVTDPAALSSVVETLRSRHGRVDILISLVGGFAPGSLVETDRPTWERMLNLNLTSAFTAARTVAPHMVAAGRGRIVTIGSRAVLPPAGGFIAYTVAKAGVIALTLALAQELKDSGVTANCVLPSTMDTPANRTAMPGSDRRGWVPVESVADAIAFLVRDDSGHVTGTLLTI
jgi:NAD(P)-dependent dehydrogenase (short-subunit alcohol dehydrogenase family)